VDASRHTALVIGCGSIGARHLRNLAALGVGRIIACDLDRERACAACDESPGAVPVSSLEEAWERHPDIAVIALPTALHLAAAADAAEHGCNLFVEKPLAATLDGVDDLVELVRDRGLVAAVGYNWRFNPMIERISSVLSGGVIGEPLWAHAHFGSYLPARHPWEDYRIGYGARADLGGGVILDAITHQFDYLVALFGWPNEVGCRAGKRSDLEINVEDVADITLGFESGFSATIHGDFVERPHRAYLELCGSEGSVVADFVAHELRVWSAATERWDVEHIEFDPNDIYVREMAHFLACVEGEAGPAVDLASAARNLRALLAAKRASDAGQVQAV
jgi:predicted dehydrogenase